MAQYTPTTGFEFSSADYTPSTDFDFQTATATEVGAYVDAAILGTLTRQAALNAAVQRAVLTVRADLGAVLQQTGSVAAAIEAALVQGQSRGAYLGAALVEGVAASAGIDAAVTDVSEVITRHLEAGLNSALLRSVLLAAGAEAALIKTTTRSAAAGATVVRQQTRQAALDAGVWTGAEHHGRSATVSTAVQLHRRLGIYPDTAPLLRPTTQVRSLRARLDALILWGDEMSLSFSTGLRNRLLGRYAHETGDGLAGAMHHCFIDVYSGAKPDSADSAPLHGTYLGTFSLGGYSGPQWGGSWREPDGGTLEKNRAEPWVMVGAAAGTAGWFRVRLIDDLNHYSITARRIDGTIGLQGSAADMQLKSVAVTVGSYHKLDMCNVKMRPQN